MQQSFLAQSTLDLRATDAAVSALVNDNVDEAVDGSDVNPTMLIAVGAVFVLVIGLVICMRSRSGNSYMAFGNKSGLSTSSSDITSSETGSTDKELKSRMERFEQRLDEHKKLLEGKRDVSSSITDSDSK